MLLVAYLQLSLKKPSELMLSSCVDGQQDGDWGRKVPPTVNKDQVHDHLRNLNVLQSTGPNEIRSRILKELADAVAKTLFIIFEKSW
ncbi:hypothetical protein TURU_037444 [Turdus rufiventris]|nr:hypothetical protein TURU_037444 [Turdus rufiventris]